MVYVVQNSLETNLSTPTSNQPITVTVWIRGDYGDHWCEDYPFPFTPTYIYLYIRNVTAGTGWQRIKTIDCTAQCCLDVHTEDWCPFLNNLKGWKKTFDVIDPLPVTSGNSTTYELLAVDRGDDTSKPPDRTGIKTIVVTRDPYCTNNPCDTSCHPNCDTCPSMSGCQECISNPCSSAALCTKKPCTQCPSQVGCTGDKCAADDYICLITDFVTKNPIVVIAGLVALYLVMSPPGRRR